MKLRARIIRTYEVEIAAEYGDDDETLKQRALDAAKKTPDAEDVVLVPNTEKGDDREEVKG